MNLINSRSGHCLPDIRNLMAAKLLKGNGKKTELLLFSHSRRLAKIAYFELLLGNVEVKQ